MAVDVQGTSVVDFGFWTSKLSNDLATTQRWLGPVAEGSRSRPFPLQSRFLMLVGERKR